MKAVIPQRLNTMTNEQKARRIMELEDALQQTNDHIAADRARHPQRPCAVLTLKPRRCEATSKI